MTDFPDDVMKRAGLLRLKMPHEITVTEAIARAIMAEREADKWQPIETAPKDGTDVLLFFPLDGLNGKYFPKRIIAGWRNDTWVWQGRAVRGYSEAYQPSHWQPLPPPPASKGEHHDQA